MVISKQTWEKIIFAVLVAITVGIAKQIYRKLQKPTNYVFLALVNFFYSIIAFLLFMSFVAGRIKVITETFPQFGFFTNSWLIVPFGVMSLALIYIFLILVLRWYFEKKPLGEVAKIIVGSIVKGGKAIKDTVTAGVEVSTTGAQKLLKKTADGTTTVAKATGESLKKVAGGVEKTARKTAEGIATAAKTTAGGVAKVASIVKKGGLTASGKIDEEHQMNTDTDSTSSEGKNQK